MCLSDSGNGRDLNDESRRSLLKKMTALGLSAPMAMALLSRRSEANTMSFLDRERFVGGLVDLIEAANAPELQEYRVLDLRSGDLPWKAAEITLKKGQEVTFLIGGRVWISREHDLWFEPGTSFNVRTLGLRPLYNPMNNTGTMVAAHDGPIEIARAMAEWANEDGALWTPEEVYTSFDVAIYAVALVWKGSALKGLESIAAAGDVGGVIGAEMARLTSPRKLPEGWHHFYMAGDDAGIFFDLGDGEIGCQTHKNGAILQKPVSVPLQPGAKVNWRWIVEELPSLFPEDQIVTHDYLSLGVEYDDGQDLTYIWSNGLDKGHTFRCPFPRWNPIETHMVIRSGLGELGQWLSEERDLYADYQTHIGGPATKAVRVWLLGVSLFQRRSGSARFADISITAPDGTRVAL